MLILTCMLAVAALSQLVAGEPISSLPEMNPERHRDLDDDQGIITLVVVLIWLLFLLCTAMFPQDYEPFAFGASSTSLSSYSRHPLFWLNPSEEPLPLYLAHATEASSSIRLLFGSSAVLPSYATLPPLPPSYSSLTQAQDLRTGQ
ncbi:hypothetical protein BC831DRAFT_478870 [Entophlyctis helioformis]|nr:hypothetical protein BC831DRAFT_478870 [Entophlyctis helioformis]